MKHLSPTLWNSADSVRQTRDHGHIQHQQGHSIDVQNLQSFSIDQKVSERSFIEFETFLSTSENKELRIPSTQRTRPLVDCSSLRRFSRCLDVRIELCNQLCFLFEFWIPKTVSQELKLTRQRPHWTYQLARSHKLSSTHSSLSCNRLLRIFIDWWPD